MGCAARRARPADAGPAGRGIRLRPAGSRAPTHGTAPSVPGLGVGPGEKKHSRPVDYHDRPLAGHVSKAGPPDRRTRSRVSSVRRTRSRPPSDPHLPVAVPAAPSRPPSVRRPSAAPRRAAGRHGRAPTACHGTRGRDASGATGHKPVQAGGRPVARRAARGDAAQRPARAPHRPGPLAVPDPSPVRNPGRFPPAVGPGRRNRIPHRRGEPARRPLIRGSPAAGSRGPRPSADSAR